MKIKTHVSYHVAKHVIKEEERAFNLRKFKTFLGDTPIEDEEELKECIKDFFWDNGDVITGEDKNEAWEINEFYIVDISELLPLFGITCCSSASKKDNYCRICGKQLQK